MRLLLALLGFLTAQSSQYDEVLAAKYVWVAQLTQMPESALADMSCGLACQQLPEVHNVRVTAEGLPLQTRGVVAEWGSSECLVAFRGSKTLLNYLLDDFDFLLVEPYGNCPECKVHSGFHRSWQSLASEVARHLSSLGCENKSLRITGHSLGAAMAALAAFDLAGSFKLKDVYTLGQPRVGNAAWVEAFEQRTLSASYFRLVDYMDAIPRLPMKDFLGYRHPGPEVWYEATRNGSYRICQDGEDDNCSDQLELAHCLLHTCDHCSYLGMNPCDLNQLSPRCVEPRADAQSRSNSSRDVQKQHLVI
eukprot:TRINITY_DN25315_c0_g1_i1.p1 TRINITY_DN25315_c0_g1~~TRINITY_DN25315_c0_g1_i1.p1  ORF type:complete len:324 (-),score=50.71 TRINITY_DN25315_c0_g1_i1:66-983(-)